MTLLLQVLTFTSMKQDLTIKGRVELGSDDLRNAALEYVTSNKKINEAVDQWLDKTHKLKAVRVRYNSDNGAVRQAVVDVSRQIKDKGVTAFSDDAKGTRNNKGGFKRKNLGLNAWLKDYFKEEKSKGNKEIPFEKLLNDVHFKFIDLERDRLSMYLHDKRMLPNIRYKKAEGIVKIGG